jgi:predicted RNA-binding protein with PUA-like domain
VLALTTLRDHTEEFGHFHLLQKANRLSVMPVNDDQWALVLQLASRRP